jgi:hypothetical protein
MKTPAELTNDAARALNQMEDNCVAVFDYATLLGVLTAGPPRFVPGGPVYPPLSFCNTPPNSFMEPEKGWRQGFLCGVI